jgi:hypothetical protein
MGALEKENEVKTFLVKYLCDEEGCEGNVAYTDGNMLLSNPVKFKHICDKCGTNHLFDHKYPYTSYKYL